MIEASFNSRAGRSAAVSGAYQYDTGQRIRLYGLPSPEELAELDDFLSGDVVTVQAQYSYAGDSQTEARLAAWDEENFVWTAAVPDVYMTRSEDVHVYVYVSYGASEESSRSKTCYEAVFRPISRPAPGTQVTEDQLNAWDELVAEVNLTLASMNTAISDAKAATASTNAAIQNAQSAAEAAEETAQKVDNLSVEAQTLAYDSEATAQIADAENGKHIIFGIPQGKPGVFTLNGKAPDENGGITLTASDVGALTSSGTADNANKLGGTPASEYLKTAQVVNNLTTTSAGYVADARALKTLQDTITAGLEWKKLGKITGSSQTLTIPACNEVHISFCVHSGEYYYYDDRRYAYDSISGAYRDWYISGYDLNNLTYLMRVVKQTNGKLSLNYAKLGSSEVTSTSYIDVWYR